MSYIKLDGKYVTLNGNRDKYITLDTVIAPSYPSCLNTNTVAWYIADDLTTITKDAGTGEVSLWKDKLNSGHDLVQNTATKLPIWSANGILFDGINDALKTAAFTYGQPEFIYMVVKQITWAGGTFFDGYYAAGGMIQQYPSSPGIVAYANGGDYPTNWNLTMNTWSIVRLLFNYGSSKLQVNAGTAVTGYFGPNDISGITLGGLGSGTSDYCNVEFKEVICRNKVDSSDDETAIYNYLKNKYGL